MAVKSKTQTKRRRNNTVAQFSVAIQQPKWLKLINDTLGDKDTAKQFIADISTVVSGNYKLQSCDAGSILTAGLLAQSLKLPLAQTLGFAYVIPYGDKAQFQIGWKGLVQLAQRSGQFERLGVRSVHKGEHIGQDEFGEDLFKFSHEFDNNEIIGYYAYFKLLNGFVKTLYWTKEQCLAHGKRYSRSFDSKGDTNVWRDLEEQMCEKTVMKQLLNKYAPLSVDLQRAVIADQAILNNDLSVKEYVDGTEDNPKKIDQKPRNNLVIDTGDKAEEKKGE